MCFVFQSVHTNVVVTTKDEKNNIIIIIIIITIMTMFEVLVVVFSFLIMMMIMVVLTTKTTTTMMMMMTMSVVVVVVDSAVSVPSVSVVAASENEVGSSNEQQQRRRRRPERHGREQQQQQRQQSLPPLPNIVIILTDDLDLTLTGGIDDISTLQQTRSVLKDEGKTFTNWFTQSPVCCPSRASLLTGRYFHNNMAMMSSSKTTKEGRNEMTPSAGTITTTASPDDDTATTTTATSTTTTETHECMHIDVDGTDPGHRFWKDYYFAKYFSKSSSNNNNNFTSFTHGQDDDDHHRQHHQNSNSINNNNPISNNYKVGIFGKHLNTENPTTFLPPGVHTMFINGGGDYIDPVFTYGVRLKSSNSSDDSEDHDSVDGVDDDGDHDSKKIHIETKQYFGYSTSIIGNTSLSWIEDHFRNMRNLNDIENDNNHVHGGNRRTRQHQRQDRQPIFALISVKAPHIQDEDTDFPKAIPEPKYKKLVLPIHEQKAPRVPNYNYTTTSTSSSSISPTTGNDRHLKHWVVRSQPPFTDIEAWNVDELYQSRIRTLQSVDDMAVDLVKVLDDAGELNNTFIVFTSDNGYRFGQFQMPQLKLHPYENDIRVPMVIRGPGIVPNSTTDVLASHVDLIPTLLGLVAKKKMKTRDQNQTLFDNDGGGGGEEEMGRGNEQRRQRQQKPYGTQIPYTMDGTDLSDVVLDSNIDDGFEKIGRDNRMEEPTSSLAPTDSLDLRLPSTRSILIEYYSLGNVRRYRHLVDTYNHTFIALRVVIPSPSHSQSLPQSGGMEDATASLLRYTDHDGKENTLYNFKYVEFRDSRVDWNCIMPPLEVELYDLAKDPYELRNLLPVSGISGTTTVVDQMYLVPSDLINLLTQKMKRMFHCKGETCRKEQRTGLQPSSNEHDDTKE